MSPNLQALLILIGLGLVAVLLTLMSFHRALPPRERQSFNSPSWKYEYFRCRETKPLHECYVWRNNP